MDNIHLWQYIVIAGPAAVMGGLAVWVLNREYIRGLEGVVLNKVSMAHIPYRSGKSHSAFLAFRAACETGQRVLYRGPGYVVMPSVMYQELVDSESMAKKNRYAAMHLLGVDVGQSEGDATWFRRKA